MDHSFDQEIVSDAGHVESPIAHAPLAAHDDGSAVQTCRASNGFGFVAASRPAQTVLLGLGRLRFSPAGRGPRLWPDGSPRVSSRTTTMYSFTRIRTLLPD